MKKTTVTIALITSVMAITLTSARTSRESSAFTGTYGVCSCTPSSDGPGVFELSLNEDHSFHYSDQSGSAQIDITGKWQSEGKSIQLTGFSDELKIHDQWKIDPTGNCIRSRKGLEFVRLYNMSLCK
jgi:hypothetical protein